MDKNNIQNEERIIRQLVQSSRIQASENLKYRIMHQIETERALAPKRAVKPQKEKRNNVLRDFAGIFGTMYAVLAIVVVGAYLIKGEEFIFSPPFLGTILLIALGFSLFWLITRVDALLRRK